MNKTVRRSFIAVLVLSAFCRTVSGRTADPAPWESVGFPDRVDRVTVPCKRTGGFLAVKCKVDGRDVGWMVIDTGATQTVVDKTVARRLGLARRRTLAVSTFAKHASAVTYRIKSISLGKMTFAEQELAALDMGEARKIAGDDFAGLLGGSILKRVPFSLDFVNETITFHKRKTFAPPQNATRHKIVIYRQRVPLAAISIAKGLNPLLMIDTGGRFSIGLETRYLRKHRALVVGKPARSGILAAASGAFEECNVPLGLLRGFGKYAPELTLSFGHTVSITPYPSCGTIGNEVLKDLKVTFDYAEGAMWTQYAPLETVGSLLERKGDVNSTDFRGITPLMRTRLIEDIRKLLDRGAEVNASTNTGYTALMFAAGGSTEVVKLLLDRGADIKARNRAGMNALLQGAMGGRPETVRLLLKAGADANSAADGDVTCLMLAALRGNSIICKLLIDAKANIRSVDKNGRTALMRAVWLGDRKTVELLLASGADINRTDKTGRTLLMLAARGWNPDIVTLLIEKGLDPYGVDMGGWTALHHAAESGNKLALQSLVQHGMDVNKTDPTGMSCLHIAAYSGQVDMIKHLLRERGMNPETYTLA